MVQEVECLQPQLHFLALRDAEVLEQRHVVVERGRTMNIRPDQRAVSTRRGRSKAGRVEVLTRLEPLARITDQRGFERDGIRAQVAVVADVARPLNVQRTAGVRLQRRTALDAGPSRNLQPFTTPASSLLP